MESSSFWFPINVALKNDRDVNVKDSDVIVSTLALTMTQSKL